MTINQTINESHRVKELINWHGERVSFWANFADKAKNNALALQRVLTRNAHAVELLKLEAQQKQK